MGELSISSTWSFMSIYNEIFNAGFDVYTFLTQKSKSKNKNKRLVIREIRDNLKRLEHRNKTDVNKGVLIELLTNDSIYKALEDDFNFNVIAPRRKVDDADIKILPKSKRYYGWTMEQVILNIDEKIVALKDINKIYNDLNSASINLSARLNNLYYLLVLCVLMLRDKK